MVVWLDMQYRRLVVCWNAYGPLLFWSTLLTLAYAQRPLYESNQNQKFLHGLARGGLGQLNRDWLAGTADPTPLFSLLVEGTYRYLDPRLFYVYQFLLYAVYFRGLAGLFASLGRGSAGRWPFHLFAATTVLLHSSVLSTLSLRHLGVDLRKLLTDGLADQYLLGPYLQPSVFGVLLVLSAARFVEGYPLRAVAWAAAATALHFTYVLGATFLVVGYSLATHGPQRIRLVGLYLLLVAPFAAYVWATFGPSSPEAYHAAQQLIAVRRIPHHCDVWQWFDVWAAVKIEWVALATYLALGTRLFPVMLTSLVCSALLTAAQVATRSATLALLFPWRPSVYLVPIATTIIVGRLVWAFVGRVEGAGGPLRAGMPWGAALVGIILAALGVATTRGEFVRRADSDVGRMMAYVREHRSPGQTYLVPIVSLSHELQRFRLGTGVPIYVDYKSHPYKDREVLEWADRVARCKRVYRGWDEGRLPDRADAAALAANGITHAILRRGIDHPPEGSDVQYENPSYMVARLPRESGL